MLNLTDQEREGLHNQMLEAQAVAEDAAIRDWAQHSLDFHKLIEEYGTPRQRSHWAANDLEAADIHQIVRSHGSTIMQANLRHAITTAMDAVEIPREFVE